MLFIVALLVTLSVASECPRLSTWSDSANRCRNPANGRFIKTSCCKAKESVHEFHKYMAWKDPYAVEGELRKKELTQEKGLKKCSEGCRKACRKQLRKFLPDHVETECAAKIIAVPERIKRRCQRKDDEIACARKHNIPWNLRRKRTRNKQCRVHWCKAHCRGKCSKLYFDYKSSLEKAHDERETADYHEDQEETTELDLKQVEKLENNTAFDVLEELDGYGEIEDKHISEYVVKKGDWMSSIQAALNGGVYDPAMTEALCKANEAAIGPNCDKIKPGQIIEVPAEEIKMACKACIDAEKKNVDDVAELKTRCAQVC
jgi:hypothetical protein